MADTRTRQTFSRLVQGPEGALDLAVGALLIAKEEYPDLDVSRYLARLDAMAGEVAARLVPGAGPHEVIGDLNRYLFDEQGFHGNADKYDDPRNSFLNEVLDRRTGIPITLSTVYIELGRRLEFPIRGVGFPGHFLVKYAVGETEIVVDPYRRGTILSHADCAARLRQMYGDQLAFEPSLLAPVGPRQILARMLTNLKAIYLQSHQYAKALAAVERILLLASDAPEELKARAILLAHLDREAEAIPAFERYLSRAPEATDAEVVKKRIIQLRRHLAMMN
jgi:regulator of sirC expression with transglutaminase-like and TPR domain